MNVLRVSGINKQTDSQLVLQDISFTQQKQEKIAIAGETGSGKSTLLKIIAGLLQPDTGEVFFEDKRVLGPEEKLLPGHKNIACLSQHFELRNNYRVEEELDYTNQLTIDQAQTIFEVCRISHLLKRKTDQLSGGEKQRISTARLLISLPRMLLLDEPFSNLDMGHKNMMKAVLNDIYETLGITCILVSHDPADTLSWADQILVLKDGRLLQKGTPEQVYRQPADEYTAALTGQYNLLTPQQAFAFCQPQYLEMNGMDVLLRPEQLLITEEGSGSVKGTINKIRFFGSHYELEVQVAGFSVIIRTDATAEYTTGDTINITLADNKVWYV